MDLKKYINRAGTKHKKTTLLQQDGGKERQEDYAISIALYTFHWPSYIYMFMQQM